MQRKRIGIMVVAIIAALVLGYLAGQRRNPELTTPVVRTYMVPPDRGDEIKAQLNHLFDQDGGGRAQVFNNGLLIVRAPEGYQGGIGRLIDELNKVRPTPRKTVHFDYWVVTGQEDKASNIESLKSLEKPLTAIAELDGPRKFRVLEHLSTNSISGQEVQLQGAMTRAKSTANVTSEGIILRLEYDARDLGNLRSDTEIQAGEFLVLGQNAVNAEKSPKFAGAPANVYYIVRAEFAK